MTGNRTDCLKEFAEYAVLNVLGMVGLSCYILADTYFVAKGLGSGGLAALNLAIPVYSFIHGTGLMLGIGGATRYSVQKSQGKTERKDEVFVHTILLMCGFAVLFTAFGIFGSEEITRFFGADEEIFAMCRTYLNVLLLFSPALLLNDVLLCFVRNDGAPQHAMAAMLGGSFSNIVLDYLFIFRLQMGIFGAVFATGLAPVISLAILSPFFIKKKNQFGLIRCRPDLRTAGYIFAGGFPSLVGEVSSGIVMMVFNGILLGLAGNIAVAAYGVIANISLVVIAVYTGIAQGIQPVVSRYYGSGEPEKARAVFGYAVVSVIVLSAVIYLGIFIGAGDIAAVFNSEGDARLQEIAEEGMKLYFTATGFAGFNLVLSIYDTSTNQVKPAGVLSLLRGFVLIVPMAFLLSGWWGIRGLWLAFPLTEATVSVIGVILMCAARPVPAK